MEFINLCHSFLIICLSYVNFSNCEDFFQCGPGLSTNGVTTPKGDINIEYGDPLEIYCILKPNTENYTSSSLMFYRDGEPVSREFIETVNSTAIRLYVKKPPTSIVSYFCKYLNKTSLVGVCFNRVSVGYKPLNVSNFICRSYNWEDLTCTWDAPENFIQTNYSISFCVGPKGQRWYGCPQTYLTENRCYLNSSTQPLYRQAASHFTFKLKAVNEHGFNIQTFKINHFANVIPAKPVNLSLVEATFNSLTIQWDLPNELIVFPAGIVHKVEYQSQWEQKNVWHVANDSEIDKFTVENQGINVTAFKLNITNLKYAHALYDIRVFSRSKAGNETLLWSQPATTTLRTKQTVPGSSPKTDIGSYETIRGNQENVRDIFIYWQQIPKYIENGDNFEYRVMSIKENGQEINLMPHNITKTYAKFEGLSYNNYTFMVVSSNKEGTSDPPSKIFVPSVSDTPPGPQRFTKISYVGYYGLIWNPPLNASDIDSYTLFWCDNKKDRPYECIGYLNWTRVSKDKTAKNITTPDEDTWYQVAISANTKTTSSGMVWASCILPGGKGIIKGGKIKSTVIKNVGPRSLEVLWKLECLDQSGTVKYFDIHYCPIISPTEAICKESIKKMSVESNPNEELFEKALLTGLTPYSTYAVNISIVTSNSSSGHESKPVYATLTEAAPDTPPESIAVTNLTHSSVTLTWLPPKRKNGVIRDYKVHWGNDSITTVENTSMATFDGLGSYMEYNISMSACTTECSETSPPISFRTEIGHPGMMLPPVIKLLSDEKTVNVTWKPPSKPGAPLVNHYNIKFESSADTLKTVMTSSDLYLRVKSGCTKIGKSNTVKAAVQAVNVDSANKTFLGPWSAYGFLNCIHSVDSKFGVKTIIFFCIFGGVLLISFFSFLFRWLWIRCKAMQNVEIKLPPNLAAGNLSGYEKDKESEYHMAMHVWNSHLQDGSIKDMPSSDQQLLLKKEKEDLLDNSVEEGEELGENRESSGCGSGHGSVSSSINEAAHISSDSGTEADQRASSPDVFSDSPNQRCLLRQRVVSSSGSGGEGYCRVASGPVGGLGYVTMPATNPSTGYVMHPPLWTTEQPPKGYVIAAPLPSHATPTTYCQVGWKPSDNKSSHDCGFSEPSSINRDRITDSEGESQLKNGPIDPTSSI